MQGQIMAQISRDDLRFEDSVRVTRRRLDQFVFEHRIAPFELRPEFCGHHGKRCSSRCRNHAFLDVRIERWISEAAERNRFLSFFDRFQLNKLHSLSFLKTRPASTALNSDRFPLSSVMANCANFASLFPADFSRSLPSY